MPAFVRNTKTFFNQTQAPVGWVKDTASQDDYTLCITSGTIGGLLHGLNPVTTALVDSQWNATISDVNGSVAPAVADLPAHQHTFSYSTVRFNGSIMISYPANPLAGQYLVTGMGITTSGVSTGTGVHSHGIQLGSGTVVGNPTGFGVKYIDFILASKE